LHELLADADEMHEREHARLLVVGLLRLPRIGKESLDVGLAAQEGGGCPRREQRVELAVAQHADQRLLLADRLEVAAGARLVPRAPAAPRLLLTAAAPMDVGGRHTVFVL